MSNNNDVPNNAIDDDLLDTPFEEEDATHSRKLKTFNILFILIVISAIGVGAYFLLQAKPTPEAPVVALPTPAPLAHPTPTPTPEPTATPTPEPTPTPAAPTPTPVPLPELNGSDTEIRSELQRLSDRLVKLITPNEMARKFVRATYSAHQGRVVQQYRPVSGPNTAFITQETGAFATVKTKKGEVETAILTADPTTFERYNPYAETLISLSPKQLKGVYTHYYPLLQKAYMELGEGPEQFHTVMMTALNNALATPTVNDDYSLVQTSVMLTFYDKELEELPPIQKLLLRMGQENRAKILQHLKQFKAEIVTFSPE